MPAVRGIGAAVAAAVAAGCGGAPAARSPIADAPEGLTVSVYQAVGQGYAVVDDRRTIEVTGRRVLLDRIDRGAALATLVIEPLGAAGGALGIEQCARERLREDPADAARRGAGAGASPGTPPARLPRTSEPPPDEIARLIAETEALEFRVLPGADADADGVDAPLVACTVRGAPGRYRVRVHHVATSYGFLTRHEIAMTAPDRATISTRFAVATPAWGTRGELVLYEGVPGAGEQPREVGRGVATLDGGTAVIALPPREVPARLVRVYHGMASIDGFEKTDRAWGQESHHVVRMLLELDGPPLLQAPAHVRVAAAGGDTIEISTAAGPDELAVAPAGLEEGTMGMSPERRAAARRIARARAIADARAAGLLEGAAGDPAAAAGRDEPAAAAGPVRLPLWTEPQLRGTRKRVIERADGASIIERFELTVSNTGESPREVWIEEPLRPARTRELVKPRPGSPRAPAPATPAPAHRTEPELRGDVVRTKVVVGPGQIERVGFTVRYAF